MKSPRSSWPSRFPVLVSVILAVAALVSPACGVAVTEQTRSVAASAEYGVVADPPLPLAPPVAPLAKANTVADHDGSVVVSLSDGAVEFVEASTTESVTVDAGPSAELRAVSADGLRAAIFDAPLDTVNGGSRIIVIDRSNGKPVTSVHEFAGTVEPEAFSTDGGRLFVIDHQVSDVPGAYRVRPFNLDTGKLDNILGPTKTPFDEDMNGVGRRQVWAPDAKRLYTLYIRQTHHHHATEFTEATAPFGSFAKSAAHNHGEPGTDGFVHVLDLEEEWAFCLDLPEIFGRGDLESTALAVSADGMEVAVADLAAGEVAFASTESLVVTRTATLPEIELPEEAELHLGLTGPAPSALDSKSVSALLLAAGTVGQWLAEEESSLIRATSSGPVTFGKPVRGITSGTDSVLVWPNDFEDGPTQLSGPARSS